MKQVIIFIHSVFTLRHRVVINHEREHIMKVYLIKTGLVSFVESNLISFSLFN